MPGRTQAWPHLLFRFHCFVPAGSGKLRESAPPPMAGQRSGPGQAGAPPPLGTRTPANSLVLRALMPPSLTDQPPGRIPTETRKAERKKVHLLSHTPSCKHVTPAPPVQEEMTGYKRGSPRWGQAGAHAVGAGRRGLGVSAGVLQDGWGAGAGCLKKLRREGTKATPWAPSGPKSLPGSVQCPAPGQGETALAAQNGAQDPGGSSG